MVKVDSVQIYILKVRHFAMKQTIHLVNGLLPLANGISPGRPSFELLLKFRKNAKPDNNLFG
jgi:hypothetical protein